MRAWISWRVLGESVLLLLGLVRRAAQEAHSRVEPNATTGVSPQSGRVCGSLA